MSLPVDMMENRILTLILVVNVILNLCDNNLSDPHANFNKEFCLNEQNETWIIKYSDFTCPYACVEWQEMCKGINFCDSDVLNCGPNLKCPRIRPKQSENVTKYKLVDSSAKNHHYCLSVSLSGMMNYKRLCLFVSHITSSSFNHYI